MDKKRTSEDILKELELRSKICPHEEFFGIGSQVMPANQGKLLCISSIGCIKCGEIFVKTIPLNISVAQVSPISRMPFIRK